MPVITLPDGSQRHYDQSVSVMQVAADIGKGLAKATLAGKVNDRLVDSAFVITEDCRIRIITDRDAEGLEVIRHSCAHLMAQAVKELFPEAQVTIGPVVEDGFYYDFAYERPFTPEDLVKIESRMEELAKNDYAVTRSVMKREEAITYFRGLGEVYKAQIIESIPAHEELSLYTQGKFTDLCRGPHVPSTGKLRAFKLTKIAGAYWRGDSRNEMLQRVYGTAWPDKKSLQNYLHRLEEAEKRDHRKLGRKLDLFHFQPEAPGMVFWHQKGWQLFLTIEEYIRAALKEFDYREVNTPQMLDRSLWEKSGHWEKFAEHMFTTSSENRDYAVKPMNCPAHVQIFNQGLKSYRDLPLRMSEFGLVHRNEVSGTLHGLMRARRFTQDDAHIFCTEGQLQGEVTTLIDLTFRTYRDFGFDEIEIAISNRPEKRVGTEEQWDKAEKALRIAVEDKELKYKLHPGEGAFYGPKIEFVLKDCIGRAWQCGTIQVDFSMPGRLDAGYIAEDGSKQVPVMIHRAILGSMERFIGILIEHYAGSFPAWLAPEQIIVISLTEKQTAAAEKIEETLKIQGFRAASDLRNETIGLKIREHAMRHVPYMLILGARELENNTVAVRTRQGEDLGGMSLDAFMDRLRQDIAYRGRTILEE